MEAEAAKLIGAGIAVLPLLGVGLGIGNIFSSLITSIARNPAARGEVFGIGILGFALTEAIALCACCITSSIVRILRIPFDKQMMMWPHHMSSWHRAAT